MMTQLPHFAKEQLFAAGLKLVKPWLKCAEFQLAAMWPQLHFGATSNTAVTQKARAAIECVKHAASTLMHLTVNNPGPSYNYAQELFEYEDQLFATDSYFKPMVLKDLPAKELMAVHRLPGFTDDLPRFGNHPALSCIAELIIAHSQLASAWQEVYGINNKLDQTFRDDLARLENTISELRFLCLETHEARMSTFAMILLQLLLAVEGDLNLHWLGVSHDLETKQMLAKYVAKHWQQLAGLISAGIKEFLEYLPFVPVGLKSPFVQAAIAAGKLVVIVPNQEVYFEGQNLTSAFKKSPTAFNDLVDLCRAALHHRVVEYGDYPNIDEGTYRTRFHRLQKVCPELLQFLETGKRKQTHRLTIPPSEIVLIERQPDSSR